VHFQPAEGGEFSTGADTVVRAFNPAHAGPRSTTMDGDIWWRAGQPL